MSANYITVEVEDILVGEPLPATLSIYIEFRFVVFRAEGHAVEKAAYDRLEFRKIKQLFIADKDKDKWAAWVAKWKLAMQPKPLPEGSQLKEAREDVHRKMLDVFQGKHPDQAVASALAASKKLVLEVMKLPYASISLSALQGYSKGTVDHSINTSVLSVYLAMNMGYSHQGILQHLSIGGLLHDIGKARVQVDDRAPAEDFERAMESHPTEGVKLLETMPDVPPEVLMIVGQHHENFDGTGTPNKMRGSKIYDLARIVNLANVFDELVGDDFGTLQERQRKAINKIDQLLYKRFDPQKLEKALKILRLGV